MNSAISSLHDAIKISPKGADDSEPAFTTVENGNPRWVSERMGVHKIAEYSGHNFHCSGFE